MSGNSLESLPSEIGQLTNLTRLSLGGTSDEEDGEGNNLESLPNEIGKLVNLTDLDLSYNSLIGADLPKELWQLTNLIELNLVSNNLTDEAKQEIEELLPFNCGIDF